MLDDSSPDLEGNVRALILESLHQSGDQCWAIKEEAKQFGFPLCYRIMKSQDGYENKYLTSRVVRDSESFWVTATNRTDDATLWFIDHVDVIREGEKLLDRYNLTASQSSSLPLGKGGAASLAIDGNKDGQKGSCTQTSKIQDSWWKVNLEQWFVIYKVVIYNRKECCQDKIDGATVEALLIEEGEDQVETVQCGKVHYRYGKNVYTIQCNSRPIANYIRINQTDNYLALCEVEIYGTLFKTKFYMPPPAATIPKQSPPKDKQELTKELEKEIAKMDKKETSNNGAQQGDHTHSEEKSSGSIYLGNIIIYFLVATGICC